MPLVVWFVFLSARTNGFSEAAMDGYARTLGVASLAEAAYSLWLDTRS